jgi:hypothetical protein
MYSASFALLYLFINFVRISQDIIFSLILLSSEAFASPSHPPWQGLKGVCRIGKNPLEYYTQPILLSFV